MKRLFAGCLLLGCAVSARAGGVTVIPDLTYSEADPKRNQLDLYMPKDAKACPVVMFIHGGGYKKGDRKDIKELGPALASHGVGVAVISYRLYPDVKHAEQIGDVALALA